MRHVYKPGNTNRALVLFHGTGGGPEDLMGIASFLDSQSPVVAFEGDVDENGTKRFFKRLKPGVFDEEDLVNRTHALDRTLYSIEERYDLPVNKMVLLGYSNGANIIASYLKLYGKKVSGAFLFQPMTPFKSFTYDDLSDLPVFLSAGNNDPIVSSEDSKRLIEALQKSGVTLQPLWHDDGHMLSKGTIYEARAFFKKHWG